MLVINDNSIASSSGVLLELNNPSQSNNTKTISFILLILSQMPSVHLAEETLNLVPNIRFNK